MVSMVYRIGGFLTFKRNKILLGTIEVFLQYYEMKIKKTPDRNIIIGIFI
jgi:hypothetical protein